MRGQHRGLRWNAGVFRAENRDDILFVTSEQTGFGYFKNFGKTRRQGLELGASGQVGRVTLGAGYTYLDATFQSAETVNGASNSTNDAAEAGARGLEGTIEIEPGDRIPLIPRHMLKAYADVQVTSALSLDLDLVGVSSSYARGNENNLHQPDGTYYLGPGTAPGYAVVNLGAHLPGQALAAAARAGQQPVRPPLLHGRAARPDRVHRQRDVHRPAISRRERGVPGPAGHVLRARRSREGVGRGAVHVLIQAGARSG